MDFGKWHEREEEAKGWNAKVRENVSGWKVTCCVAAIKRPSGSCQDTETARFGGRVFVSPVLLTLLKQISEVMMRLTLMSRVSSYKFDE